MTITQIFANARHRPSDWLAVKYPVGGAWKSASWAEVYNWSSWLAGAFAQAGLGKGDTIAILSNTRLEWLLCDFAIMGLGGVTVPIYPSHRPEELEFILQDSQAKALIVEDEIQLKKWMSVQSRCPSVKHVLILQSGPEVPEGVTHWSQTMASGKDWILEHPQLFEQSVSGQSEDDPATIIYTSGTTGEPKGALLSHRQIRSEVQDALSVIPLSEKDTALTFLPYAHVFGRIESWCAVASGCTLAFAESIDRLRVNLEEIKPTLLVSVPRVFEKIYSAIMAQAESNPITQHVFEWASAVGREASDLRQKSKALPLGLLTSYKLADRLVFKLVQKKLGGRLRFAISGGAPLSPEIAQFFHAHGVLILEGYGLTETTAAITVNTPVAYRLGSVGRPLPDVKIRLAEDGEILVQSDKVLASYYNRPEDTAAAFREGYFCTGDIGEIDRDGFLWITDRKKDLIKTAGGKYVAPQKLENLLKTNPLIANVLIHGDMEKYIVALITLNRDKVLEYAQQEQISFQDYASLTQHPQVKALVRTVVASFNSQLASYETIKNFAILPRDFTIEDGELTPSLKVKRKSCSLKYKTLLNELYS